MTKPGTKEMEMGNRNEEMEMKKWRNGGNKSGAWRMTLSLLWRCGQGRLHQPGNKMGTCNISSKVAGTSEILASLYRFPTCTNEVASYSNSILVPVGGMR